MKYLFYIFIILCSKSLFSQNNNEIYVSKDLQEIMILNKTKKVESKYKLYNHFNITSNKQYKDLLISNDSVYVGYYQIKNDSCTLLSKKTPFGIYEKHLKSSFFDSTGFTNDFTINYYTPKIEDINIINTDSTILINDYNYPKTFITYFQAIFSIGNDTIFSDTLILTSLNTIFSKEMIKDKITILKNSKLIEMVGFKMYISYISLSVTSVISIPTAPRSALIGYWFEYKEVILKKNILMFKIIN